MRRAALAVIGVLAVLGIIAGMARTGRAVAGLSTDTTTMRGVAEFDSATFEFFSALAGTTPGSAHHAEYMSDTDRLTAKFAAHPVATLLHVVPGTLFMMLGPLQFSRRIRARRLAWHRWSGRALLLLGIPIAGSALFILWWAPHAGPPEIAVVTIFAAFFIVAGVTAYAAIRRLDIARHRRWMIRYFAAGLAISTVRVVSIPIIAIQTLRPTTALVLSMALGWMMTIGAAEWWIRRTPQPAARPVEPVPAD